MKHGRVRTEIKQPDGTTVIKTEGYYESLNSVKQEIRQTLITTNETLMQDLIKAMEVFTQTDCPEIELKIVKHNDKPSRITRTHVVYKEKI